MTLATERITDSTAAERRIQVWDTFVRIFHWTVAVAFFVAYFSEDDLLTVHVWAGYSIGALVILRIAWGFVGPEHARFRDFLAGPWTALRYLVDLFAGRAKRHLGHSPAGGVMVLLLLAGLLGRNGVARYRKPRRAARGHLDGDRRRDRTGPIELAGAHFRRPRRR